MDRYGERQVGERTGRDAHGRPGVGPGDVDDRVDGPDKTGSHRNSEVAV